MSDALEAQDDAEVVETVADVVEETPQAAEGAEEKARRQGWRPKEEFSGPEEKWVDADTFLQRAKEALPLAKADVERLEKANKKLASELSDLKLTMRQFGEHYTRVEKRAYDAALRDLEARQAQAVQDNDLEGVRTITKEITDLSREIETPKAQEAGPSPAYRAFVESNGWFNVDEDLTAYALGLRFPADTPEEEQLRLISEKVRRAFPHKFENPARKQAAAVDGGGTARKSSAKTYSDLPAEARTQCDRFVKQGLLTREQYVKDYQW